jgi:excisionase family DNA binding protein
MTGIAAELLTAKQFALALSVTEAAVRKWISQRRLRPVRLGRSVRLRRSDLDQVIAQGLDALQVDNRSRSVSNVSRF